ncbi:MAG: EamA family transporter [Promethearchaeota archaeon]
MKWFYAIKHVDASVASRITTPTPIITLIFVYFILKENVEVYQIIVIVIVFVSLYGLIWSGRIKHNNY